MITCTFEDGGTGKLRHTVVDNIVVKDGKILLVKRAARLQEGGKWAFPAGFMGRDESAKQTGIREAKEETGWEIDEPQLFMINDSPRRRHEDRQSVSIVFVCRALRQTGEADDESTDIRWFPLDQTPTEEEMAFDHHAIIEAYKEWAASESKLPVFASDLPVWLN